MGRDMGWGERHDSLWGAGTTGEMTLAQDALMAVGIKKPNMSLAAVEAAGIIDRLRAELKQSDERYAELYDATRCPEEGCQAEKGHDGQHYAWEAV